jgi:hypothetical protein
MPNTLESVVEETPPDTNINAPPGQPDANNRPEPSSETAAELNRRLTEEALAIAGAPGTGTGSANAILSPSEESDSSEMANDNPTVDDKLPDKIRPRLENFRGAAAAVGGIMVVNQLTRSFPGVTRDPVIGVALPLTPLLLLDRGSGPMAVATAAAATGIAVAERLTRGAPGRAIVIDRDSVPPRPVSQGVQFKLQTNAPDPTAVNWDSSDRAIADVADGVVTPGATPGNVSITAKLDGASDVVFVTVE